MKKGISVIIPTYNRIRFLKRAIASVLYQDWKEYEIIVVDDGSTDGTKEELISVFGKKIKIISHPENRGVSAARNTGIRNARYPFIAFLDSDDYWFSKKLSFQMDFFEKKEDAVICQTEEIWIRKGRRVNPKKKHKKLSGDIFKPSLRLCLISPSAVMLKKELFDEVGLFDEDLPVCEDYDMWLRICWKYPVYLIEKPLVVKEGGHSDQLSSRYWGMDRFRIYSILKLINSTDLNEEQLHAAIEELKYKCRIYGNGCIKRGRYEEGRFYLSLPQMVIKDPLIPFLELRHLLFQKADS